MKTTFLSLVVMLLSLSSCRNQDQKQEASPRSNAEPGGIGQVMAPTQKGLKTPVNWSGQSQEWVHAYRNDSSYFLPVRDGEQLAKLHGIAIDIADVTSALDHDDDGIIDSNIRKLYIMPALRSEEVGGSQEEVFTIVMAPLRGDPNQNDVDPSMEVITSDNQAYNLYSPCPPECPTINWFGNEIPDGQATKRHH